MSQETRGTPAVAQLRFLEDHVLRDRADFAILDLCCGHGRHLAGLQGEGRSLTGIDNSEYFLAVARAVLPPDVELRLEDATTCDLGREFEVILCLENSFVFGEADAARVMRTIAAALAEGGVAVIHLTDPDFAATRLPRRSWRNVADEWFILEERSYDEGWCLLKHRRFHRSSETSYDLHEAELTIRLRRFDELTALASSSGLRLVKSFGSFAGEPRTDESPEMICLFERELRPVDR